MNTNNIKNICKKHKSLILSIVFVLSIAILSGLGQSRWFKASVLDVSTPFDGAIFPIAQSPNYLAWSGNIKTTKYSEITPSELINLPDYSLAINGGSNDDIKNAQLTFPVVYLGGYEGDHKEDVGSHLAVDIRVPEGTPIVAIANGIVTKVKRQNSGFGYHLCINHSHVPSYPDTNNTTSLISCYNHLSEISTEEGDFVYKGDLIGKTGTTGTSTTPHLHFQIDKTTAPWSPYWPFSGSEATSANLSFFDAVSEGLGQDKAQANTVNPMKWISANFSSASSKPQKAITNNTQSNTDSISFEISSDSLSFTTTETTTINITAKKNNNINTDYKPSSSLTLSSNSPSAIFPKTLQFTNGQASISVQNEVAESFSLSIAENDNTALINLISEAPEEETLHAAANETTETLLSNDIKPEVTPTEAPQQTIEAPLLSQVHFSGDTTVFLGTSAHFEVILLDQDAAPLTVSEEAIDISVSEGATLSPNTIDKNNITSPLLFTLTSDSAGTYTVKINNFQYSIEIINEIKSLSAFHVSIQTPVKKNSSNTLNIQAIDEDGNNIPQYTANGDVLITFEEGSGKLSKTTLSAQDFHDGKAEVFITPHSDTVQIRASNGAYNGKTRIMTTQEVKKTENIFTDVPFNHKNATAIAYLKDNNIIGGYPDGSFQPNKSVSRIEALKMLLLGLDKGISPSQEVTFPDTDKNAWYSSYIGRALNLGMVKGYPDGSFKPANSVNRAEYYKILLEAAEAQISQNPKASFSDVPNDAWFSGYADFAKENKITDATSSFQPSGNVTRAEVAETLYRIIQLNNKQ